MNGRTLPLALVLFVFALPVAAGVGAADEAAAREITSVIERCYVNGAFNDLDPAAMREGFHPDFAIFSADGEQISRYPIDVWAKSVESRKESPDFDPAKNRWDHRFASIDVTGGAASAKVELLKDGQLVYTDYLSLLEFDSGWRIVAKVYHEHTE